MQEGACAIAIHRVIAWRVATSQLMVNGLVDLQELLVAESFHLETAGHEERKTSVTIK